MKEIPILFSTDMVKAILEGRKTQTRRILKMPKDDITEATWGYTAFTPKRSISFRAKHADGRYGESFVKCPYGKRGDIFFVRESHYRFGEWKKNGLTKTGKRKWKFQPNKNKANFRYQDNPPFIVEKNSSRLLGWYKRPSLFMPKEFTRIWLEVTNIRVERLHDISEADAIAEGINLSNISGDWEHPPSEEYKALWEKINGPDSWEENPFVWVISFKVLSTTGKPKPDGETLMDAMIRWSEGKMIEGE